MKRPLFLFGLFFLLSLGAVMWAGVWIALALVPGVVFVLLLPPRWKKRQHEGLLASVCCAFLSAVLALAAFEARLASAGAHNGTLISFTGYVLEESEYSPTLKVIRAESPEAGRVTLRLQCYNEEGLEPGDWVSGTTAISQAVPDGGSILSLGVSLTGVAGELKTAQPQKGEGFLWRTAQLRHQLARAMVGGSPTDGTTVLVGLLFSERTYLSPAVRDGMNRTGTGHLLSVSGLHMSIVAGWVLWLCRHLRLGRLPTLLLGLCTVALVSAMAGFSLSALRAGVMSALWLVGRAIHRRSDGLTSLAVAACVLLAVNPHALWEAGFQMSLSATLGILLMARPMAGWLVTLWEARVGRPGRIVKGAASVVGVSLAAQLALIPAMGAVYGFLPVYSLPANLLLGPLVWPALLLGALGAVGTLVPTLGAAGLFFISLASLLCRWIVGVCGFFARLPGGVFPLQLPYQWVVALGLLGTAAACVLFRLKGRKLLRVLSLCLSLCLVLGAGGAVFYSSRTVVTASGGGVVIRRGNHAVLLFEGESDYDIKNADGLLLRTGLSGAALQAVARAPGGTREWDHAAVRAFAPRVLLTSPENVRQGPIRPMEGVEVLPLSAAPVELWEGTRLTAVEPWQTLAEADGRKILKMWAGYGIISEADIPEDAVLLVDLAGNAYSPGGQVGVLRLWTGDSVAVLPP